MDHCLARNSKIVRICRYDTRVIRTRDRIQREKPVRIFESRVYLYNENVLYHVKRYLLGAKLHRTRYLKLSHASSNV